MSAPLWNIILEEGSDFNLQVQYKVAGAIQNVAGYGAQFTIRNDYDSPSLVTCSVANTRILVAGLTGQFDINIPVASVDPIIQLLQGEAGYTLKIWPTAASSDVDPIRLLQGCVEVSREYA